MRWGSSRNRSALLLALLALVLTALGSLQVHWIQRVSEADRRQWELRLRSAARRFSEDFEREISRVGVYFFPGFDGRTTTPRPAADRLAERLRLWQADAPYPELLAELYLTERSDGDLGLLKLDFGSGRFEPVPWPADLEWLRQRLASRPGGWPHERWERRSHAFLLPDAATVVLPAELPAPQQRGGGPHSPAEVPLAILRFDREFLSQTLLPELVSRHFDQDFSVVVRQRSGQERPPDGLAEETVLYRSHPELPISSRPDLAVPLVGMRPPDAVRGFGPGGPRRFRPDGGGRRPSWPDEPREPDRPGPGPGPDPGPGPGWELLVVHRLGSLDAVVERTRLTNLAVAAGVLLLLGGSGVLLLVAEQRARRLAKQQTEFVAGLTHELHTPLAAIRSAAENLADGVVAEPDRVREYGKMIHRQGSRLSSLVAQALELAGMQAAEPVAPPGPVDLEPVVEAALESCAPLATEHGVEIETSIEGGLPPVLGRPEPLQQAIENLMTNAIKYGAAGGVARLAATRAPRAAGAPGARMVEIRVEDEGPGFAREEMSRLFEPFYRGRAAVRGVPGSGLGLSLVRQIAERYGGTVRAEARRGGGSAFVLRLPAAEEVVSG